jgi:hypothetical protein
MCHMTGDPFFGFFGDPDHLSCGHSELKTSVAAGGYQGQPWLLGSQSSVVGRESVVSRQSPVVSG